MSLQVDDSGRRGRSRSPSGRRRERDEDDYERERDRSRGRPPVDAVSYSEGPGGDRDAAYEYERLAGAQVRTASPPDNAYYGRGSHERVSSDVGVKHGDGRREKDHRYEKERDRDSDRERDKARDAHRASLQFLPQKYASKMAPDEAPESPRYSRESVARDREREKDRDSDREHKYEEDLAYGSGPIPPAAPKPSARPKSPLPDSPSASYKYAEPKQWEYSKPSDGLTYNSADASPGPTRSAMKRDASPGPLKSAMKRDASPQPPTARMSSLSVQTGLGAAAGLSLAAAPGSPLLESYHGTYQSMSPMPSPLLLPNHGSNEHIETVSPIGSDDERGDKKRSRRARFHDPVDDAARLAKALKGEKRAPEIEPLIEILPGLTQEQVMELRVEYKRLVKTGSERKGVNIAKHIRARLKDEDPSLMKACYATALGQWESEAYWANFWYQGDKTRRELLIEALMGRTNDEIREIKAGFSDKKYSNSLSKCMRTELKEDKFKKAVLLVLDEQRMDEYDAYGRPVRIDMDLVRDDVKQLHHAVKSEKGGESLMITIVVQRSDSHLREVLRKYTEHYGSNLAKDALKKSGNLVGEVLAHILNGVINKPARDALLLHHAVTASKRDELRRELLISRLVRYHWDRKHMAAIKHAYRERYGQDLQEVVRQATSGDWGEFCRALCISRMPDDVKRVERVEIIR
ncbi:Annexin [Thozetella sp. PMI_491]|nr:Annexin [Thozetella sp. PMI_491]